MATLTNVLIKNSYDALLKLTDNDPIASTPKQVTDGLGNTTQLFISDTKVGIGLSPTTQFHTNSDAKIGGNLIVVGNLEVQGTTTRIDTSTLSVEDPLIILASNNTSDASDIGFYGKYRPSSTDLYSGLFRDATDEKYHLFKDLQTEPTTTVNKSGTGYAVATLVANFEGTATTQSQNDNSTKLATTAYVDTAVDSVDTLAEILAVGNTTGGTNISVSANDDIDFSDSSEARFGSDQDLIVKHNGSNATIENKVGNLNITQSTDDGDIKFFCDDGSGSTENYLQIDGGEQRIKVFNEMRLNDNVELRLGTGNDLRIHHNSTNSLIQNYNGDLEIRQTADDSDIKLMSDDSSGGIANYVVCDGSTGAVKLSHYGTVKLETTSSGIDVTGDGLISGDLGIGSTGIFASAVSLNIDGTGLAIKNNVSGSSNNWSIMKNSATGSSANFEFVTGAGTSLTLNHDKTATFTNSIQAADGSAGSPSITFSGDTDTGIYRTSSNAINFGTNGTERMRLTNSGLAIGTTSLTDANAIHCVTGLDNDFPTIKIETTSTTRDASMSFITNGGNTFCIGVDASDSDKFKISDNAILGTNDRFTIDSSGNCGIGTDSPDFILCIEDSEPTFRIFDTDNTLNQEQTIAFGTEPGNRTHAEIASINLNTGNAEGALLFKTNSGSSLSESMRIASDGKLGLNTTSPSQLFHCNGNALISKLGVVAFNAGFDFYNDGTSYFNGAVTIDADLSITESNGEINFGAGNGVIQTTTGSTSLTFGTNSTEVARCHSTGSFMINTTSVPSDSSLGGAAFEKSGALSRLKQSATSTSTIKLQVYYNANGEVGSIHTSGSATAFNTSSDYRLKDDYKDFNGLDLVSNINVYDFEWKSDKTRSYGVKAHELQEVIPQAVNGQKDGEEMQQVDYSKLVPILLKSIQELKKEIEILKLK